MTNTFAIDVIQVLNVQEVMEFRAFLESSYFNKGPNAESIIPFFDVLYQFVHNGNIIEIEKKDLHGVLFPGKTYVESKIDKLMSDLKRLLERFILIQRYFSSQNEAQYLLDLTTEMRVRGLESRHQQSLDRTKRFVDTTGEGAVNDLFFKYLVAKEEQAWYTTHNKVKTDLNIPETVRSLDTFYYAQKTWMLNHLMLLQRATMLPDTLEEEERVWEIPNKIAKINPLISISWEIHQLLKKETCKAEDFQRLVKNIKLGELSLSSESLSEVYAYLRNLCVIMIDAGQIDLYGILHEINNDNLERGYFYKNDKISPNACLNITQVAINAGAVAWAKNFLEQHKEKIIDENEAHDFYKMNKALCLFGEKKYEEALEIIPFGSTYSFYHLMARRLELKIYYELHSDLLDHKIEAFKMFISRAGRKVFSANLHELFINFVNFVRQLHQSGPDTKQRSETLIKRITQKKMVAERLWLLEKARELGKK